MNGDQEEANDSGGAGVFGAWLSEDEKFQLGQGDSELGHTIVV